MAFPTINRRDFLKGCCASAAVAGAPAMFYAPAAQAGGASHDTIVHVFLRGGIDGLNLVVPIAGNDRVHYEQARPNLRINATGSYAALPLVPTGGGTANFGLHPSAIGLHELWGEGRLAIVHACGLKTSVTRSHFDAQLYYDLGTPGRHGTPTGWLTRAWTSQPGAPPLVDMPALAVNSRQPASLLGSTAALTLGHPADFAMDTGPWEWMRRNPDNPAAFQGFVDLLPGFLSGRSMVEQDAARAEQCRRTVVGQAYANPPAGWPDSEFARQLWTVAQSIRFGLGLRYAALDLGGWDTHEGQGTAGSGWHYYQNKIAELSQALAAFYANLEAGGEIGRVTVVVQSEFGRRVQANASWGTDHGYGNPLLVLGGAVNGRRFFGQWSGLDPDVLAPYFGDVPCNTDFRQVLSELLIRRMGNNRLGAVFPGYTGHVPLGIVQGADMAPVYGEERAPSRLPTRTTLPAHPQPAYGDSMASATSPASRAARGRAAASPMRRGLRAANRRLVQARLEAYRMFIAR